LFRMGRPLCHVAPVLAVDQVDGAITATAASRHAVVRAVVGTRTFTVTGTAALARICWSLYFEASHDLAFLRHLALQLPRRAGSVDNKASQVRSRAF
jgi:hypothetical protein